MTDSICKYLKSRLLNVTYFDVFAGRVQRYSKQVNDGSKYVVRTVPITSDINGIDCAIGEVVEVLPDSNKKGILFFECDDYQRVDKRLYQCNVRLVCWLNFKKLFNMDSVDESYLLTIQKQVESKLITRTQSIQTGFTLFSCTIDKGSLNGRTAFQNYTLDETVRQYLTQPYTAFTCDFKVLFYMNPVSCDTSPVLNVASC